MRRQPAAVHNKPWHLRDRQAVGSWPGLSGAFLSYGQARPKQRMEGNFFSASSFQHTSWTPVQVHMDTMVSHKPGRSAPAPRGNLCGL